MPSNLNAFFDHLMDLGIAAACPSNDCNQIRQGPDGQWQVWHPGSQSSRTTTDTDGNVIPVITTTIGGWGAIPAVALSSSSIFNSISSRLGSALDQLRRSPWSLSGVIPVVGEPGVAGVGPAYNITYIPSSHTICLGGGLGASVGRDASLSVPVAGTGNWPQNAKDIAGGWSISGGATAANGVGVQGNWSPGNGKTLSPSAGIPGVSIAVTWSACF
jgi:hypothetical protein